MAHKWLNWLIPRVSCSRGTTQVRVEVRVEVRVVSPRIPSKRNAPLSQGVGPAMLSPAG